MSSSIRIYFENRRGKAKRTCYNVGHGLRVLDTVLAFYRVVAIGCEEGAMVIHVVPDYSPDDYAAAV